MWRVRHHFSVAFALLAICVVSADAQSPEMRGEDVLSRHCAMCHAIGRSGTSPEPKAPPFRTLHLRVPVESLEMHLGNGLLTGHPQMPAFSFQQQDVSAIMRYLQSIQER
jgi:mono/diheme cytochrome c family protein